MNWFQKLLSNGFLLVALSSWFWAQLIKTIIHAIVTKKVDFTRLVGDGGMPSGHSATVSSLAVSAAMVYGLGSFEFAIALVFAIVVCKDAMGVRLETGKQAAIITATSTEALPDLLRLTAEEGAVKRVAVRFGYFTTDRDGLREMVREVQSEVEPNFEQPWQVYFYPDPDDVGIVEVVLREA